MLVEDTCIFSHLTSINVVISHPNPIRRSRWIGGAGDSNSTIFSIGPILVAAKSKEAQCINIMSFLASE
jgi:hypothetical protein